MQPDPGRGAPPDTLIDLICYLELPDHPAIVPAGAGVWGGAGRCHVLSGCRRRGRGSKRRGRVSFNCLCLKRTPLPSQPPPQPPLPQHYTCTFCPRPPPESQPAQSGRLCDTRRRQAAQTSDQIFIGADWTLVGRTSG